MSYTVINCEQGTEEWRNARKCKITASIAKKIITPTGKLSASADDLIIDLVTESIVDDPILQRRQEMLSLKDEIAWGNLHEPDARKQFVETTDLPIKEVGFLQSHLHIALGCSPDGFWDECDEPYGLELKCPLSTTHARWHYEKVLPAEHVVQVHFSMAVTGVKSWYFMSYYPGLKPFIVRALRDDYTEKVKDAVKQAAEKYQIESPKIREMIMMD